MKPFFISLLCWIAALYIRLVFYTSRKITVGTDMVNHYLTEQKPCIIAFWHGRLLMMSVFARDRRDIFVIISRHGDGELIARTVQNLGFGVIRGSSNRTKTTKKGSKNRGGVQALKSAVDTLKKGHAIGITPDGPRGPRYKAYGTVIDLARMTGAPIIPVSHSQSRRLLLNSWDAFQVSLPFCKSVLYASEPIFVAKNASKEEVETTRKLLEDRLTSQTDMADYLAGHAPR